MENSENKLIIDFFRNNKKDIVNNGFSDNVMKALPEKKTNQWIIPTAFLLGFYVSLLLIDVKELIYSISLFICNTNPLIYAAFFLTLPFIILAFWYFNQKNETIFR